MVISRAPEAPRGWPSAIAPPTGFSRSRPVELRCHASGTLAKASLTSTAARSDAAGRRVQHLLVAGIGPVSIRDRVVADDGGGPDPGARSTGPRASARSSVMTSRALAPSEIWEEYPAVTFHSRSGNRARHVSLSNAGARPESRSTLVPGRIVSSFATIPFGVVDPDNLGGGSPWLRRGRASERRSRRVRRGSAPISARRVRRRYPAAPGRGTVRARPGRGDPRRAPGRAHRHPAHGFHAGGDDDVVGPRDHALHGEIDRLLARSALTFDHVTDGTDVGKPAASTAWRPGVADCSPEPLTHPTRTSSIRAGSRTAAVGEGAQHLAEQVGGVHVGQRPGGLAPTYRGAGPRR